MHQVNILETKQNREAKWINLKTYDKDIVPWWNKATKKWTLSNRSSGKKGLFRELELRKNLEGGKTFRRYELALEVLSTYGHPLASGRREKLGCGVQRSTRLWRRAGRECCLPFASSAVEGLCRIGKWAGIALAYVPIDSFVCLSSPPPLRALLLDLHSALAFSFVLYTETVGK